MQDTQLKAVGYYNTKKCVCKEFFEKNFYTLLNFNFSNEEEAV